MRARPERPLLLIDIAVPRDVDPLCAQLAGVQLFDIDDLQTVVAQQPRRARGRGPPRRGRDRGGDPELRRVAGLSSRSLPTIAALRAHADAIVERVLEENERRWESLSERDRDRIEAIARTVANRLLHEPTLQMKQAGGDRVHARIGLLRELFGLEDVAEPADEAGDDAGGADVRELRRRGR